MKFGSRNGIASLKAQLKGLFMRPARKKLDFFQSLHVKKNLIFNRVKHFLGAVPGAETSHANYPISSE